MLLFKNSQLVVPLDLFNYLSYWAAIQSSVVPSVRVTATWLLNNVYFGLEVSVCVCVCVCVCVWCAGTATQPGHL